MKGETYLELIGVECFLEEGDAAHIHPNENMDF